VAERIGVFLPTVGRGPGGQPGDIAACARHAENLGIDSVWAGDQIVVGSGAPMLDATITLTTAAAVTERLRVGYGVLILPLRPVAAVAKQVATLQRVSGNRLILGVGSGGTPHGVSSWQAVGVPQAERGRLTDAGLAVLPGLVRGEPTRLNHLPGTPTITLAPGAEMPPVIIGGAGRVAIRRTLQFGDAWFPSMTSPEAVAGVMAILRRGAAERGRPAPGVTTGVVASLGVGAPSREAVVSSLAKGYNLSIEQAASIPITGGPDEAAERMAAHFEVGAGELVVSFAGGDWFRQVELLSEARAHR
jgi:alkanesulfonate monooxygenase SsuD/methylene tetrahydromethanopterin reductase-like flavin-dependent oxidoreductase (luciferase family)